MYRRTPPNDDTDTMSPLPRAAIAGAASDAERKYDRSPTRVVTSHSASESRTHHGASAGAWSRRSPVCDRFIVTLFTSTSSRPPCSPSTRAKSARVASSSAASHTTPTPRPGPAADTSAAAASIASRRRPVI